MKNLKANIYVLVNEEQEILEEKKMTAREKIITNINLFLKRNVKEKKKRWILKSIYEHNKENNI